MRTEKTLSRSDEDIYAAWSDVRRTGEWRGDAEALNTTANDDINLVAREASSPR